MSRLYIERLRVVSREYNAVQQAVGYVIINWDAQNIDRKIKGVTPRDFRNANTLLERTYLIRLFAEFKGILKDHLDTNHSSARWRGRHRAEMRDKLEVDENITLVVRENKLRLAAGERQRLLAIRQYRNSIAHLNSTVPSVITFGDALSRLNAFLAKLPEPLR